MFSENDGELSKASRISMATFKFEASFQIFHILLSKGKMVILSESKKQCKKILATTGKNFYNILKHISLHTMCV